MDIKIKDTAAAIDDANILVSCANKLSSIVNTMSTLKRNFEENWIEEGIPNKNRQRIVDDLGSNIDYYVQKIIPALEKLGNAVNAYAIATEQIAAASVDNQMLAGITPSYFVDSVINSKEYFVKKLISFKNGTSVGDYSTDLVKKYDNNYVKIKDFESYGNVLYKKLELEKYGYENGVEFLDDYMKKCQSYASSNREKSIYSALGFTDLASSIDMKADYDWGGGHNTSTVTTKDLSTGLDCSGYVSYLIQQGSVDKFDTTTTHYLKDIGNGCDISFAQSGDIAVNSGHTLFVLSNNSYNNSMIVTEAANSSAGIIVKEYSYNYLLNNGYNFRDLSNIYND